MISSALNSSALSLRSYTAEDQHIKNMNKQNCFECVYYMRPKWYNHYFAGCAKFGTKDVVSGRILYEYAEVCRKDKNLCGEYGRYFTRSYKYTFLRNGLCNKAPIILGCASVLLYCGTCAYIILAIEKKRNE
jgi:hypothetical protein